MSQPAQRQMSQRPGRRLPPARRLDYILIPAPTDLPLSSLTDEKSPLPAIIVTPSSPTHSRDYAIAFLAKPEEPSLLKRCVERIRGRGRGIGEGKEGREGGEGGEGEGEKRAGGWVKERWTKLRDALPIDVGFGSIARRRLGRGGYVALPISAPPSPTAEFSVPTYPNEEEGRKTTSKVAVVVVLAAVVVLVLCHFVAGAVMRSSIGAPPENVGVWASTTPLDSTPVAVDMPSPIVDAGKAAVGDTAGKGVEVEAGKYADIARVGVKQWFGWVAVAGKKRGGPGGA